MPPSVSLGASLQCSFGMTPSSLIVLPINKTTSTFLPCATIMDNIPLLNIPPFGMCSSLANPTVAAATAAALGVLTPMPCIPVTVAPWAPGCPTVLLGGKPALTTSSICNCMWAGIIKINSPGQSKFIVP